MATAPASPGRTTQSLSVLFNLVDWAKAHLEPQDRQPLIDAFAKAGEAPKSQQDLLLMSKDDLKALGLGMFQRNRVYDVLIKLKAKAHASVGGVSPTDSGSSRNVFCMGSLKKRTVKNVGGLGIWKKRFCQVQDGVFKYWDGDDAKGKLKGTIDMTLVTVVKVSEADHGLSRLAFSVHNATKFELHVPSKQRVYLWAASTPAIALEWMHALVTHCVVTVKADPTVAALEKAIEEGKLDPHAAASSPPSSPKAGGAKGEVHGFSQSTPNLLAGVSPSGKADSKQQDDWVVVKKPAEQSAASHDEQAAREQALLEKLWKVIDDTQAQVDTLKSKVDGLILKRTQNGDVAILDVLGAPVHTCVNCFADYRVNGEGHCRYHPGDLVYKRSGNNNYQFACCSAASYDWQSGMSVPGCAKTTHESKPHTKYPYVFAQKYALFKESKLHQTKLLDVVCTDYWAADSAVDYELIAGNRTDGKLYLAAKKEGDYLCYHKFTPQTLLAGVTDSVVYNLEQKDGLSLQMKWQLKGTTITGVELSGRAPRSTAALHKAAQLHIPSPDNNDSSDTEITAHHVQTLSNPASAPNAAFTLTKLTDMHPARIVFEKKESKTHQSTGGGPFSIAVVPEDRYIDTPHSSEGVTQVFRDNLRCVNRGGKTAITKLTAAFWKDGKWENVTELITGTVVTGWRNDRQFESDARIIPLNVDDKVSFDVAVVSRIHLKDAKPIEHRDIINPAFGEPVRIQYTVTTSDGVTNQIVSEFVSRQLDFYDLAGWMKDNRVDDRNRVLLYVECDDVSRLKRYRYAAWLTSDKELHVRCLQSSTYMSFTQRALFSRGAAAAKEGKKEVEITEPYVDDGNTFQAWLLVDVASGTSYGIRVHMKTSTGENHGSCLIPFDLIKER